MCKILEISTSGYYSYKEPINVKDENTEKIINIFNQSAFKGFNFFENFI